MFKSFAGLMLVFLSFNTWAESVTIEDAWIREAPPTATVMAAYMHIHNRLKENVSLLSVDCDQYDTIEIHKTVMEGELASMVKIEALEVPAGEHVDLKPGGLHIMLIGVKKRPVAGDEVKLTLKFSDDSQQDVMAKVKKVTGKMPMHQHHEHHH